MNIMTEILNLDRKIFAALNLSVGENDILNSLMVAISDDRILAIFGALIFVFIYFRKKIQERIFIVLCLASVGLTDAFCFFVLKPVFRRLRPCYALDHVHLIANSCGGDFGFPSNHAANSMACAFMFFLVVKKNIPCFLGFFLSVVVGYSRIYLGVHYPLDVFVGFLVGSFVSIFVFYSTKRIDRLQRLILKFTGEIK